MNTVPLPRRVLVHSTPEEMSLAGAAFIAELARATSKRAGSFSVALSGGSTPRPLYELMASATWAERLPWSRVRAFWGDERWVGAECAKSNYRMANEALLSRVSIARDHVYPIPTDMPEPEDAARLYAATLREKLPLSSAGVPRFDLVLLGLGADGHTASLFPGAPAAFENKELVVATQRPSSTAIPTGSIDTQAERRLSLTLPVLNAAAEVLFVVSGASKAARVADVLGEPTVGQSAAGVGSRDRSGTEARPRLPASAVYPTDGRVTWLLDEAAASQIDEQWRCVESAAAS